MSSSLSNFLINVTRSGHAGRGVMPRLRRPGRTHAIGSGGSVIEGPIRHTISPEVSREKNPDPAGVGWKLLNSFGGRTHCFKSSVPRRLHVQHRTHVLESA